MNKLNSFQKQFIAFVKGDDAEALSQKVWRQAESGLKVQIAALSGDLIRKEDKVASAEEKLAGSLVNFGKTIEDRDSYVQNLIQAKEELIQAEEDLQNHKDTICFLEEQYDLLKTKD